jgi:hypothetical protein
MFEGMSAIFALAIPILAVVLGIGIAFYAMYIRHREKKLLLEKNITDPAMVKAYLNEQERRNNPQKNLRTGLILFFLGLGFVVAWMVDPGSTGLAIAAAIIGFLGLGFIAFWAMTKNDKQ